MRFISFWNHLIFLWRRHREKEKTLGNPPQYASNNSAQYWPILERLGVGLGQCCIELHRGRPWECFGRESLIQSPAQLETAIKKKEKQQQKQKLRIFHLLQNAVEFSRGNL